MQVTGVKVMYRRVRRPADFESIEGLVEFSAQAEADLAPGGDYGAKADEMLEAARKAVLSKLGLTLSPATAATPATAGGNVVVQNPVPAGASTPTQAPTPAPSPAPTTEAAKPKATKPAKAKDTQAAATPAPAAPAAPESQRQISANPENRVDPAQPAATSNDDAFPSAEPASTAGQPVVTQPATTAAPKADKPYGVQELHGYVSDCIANKIVDGTFVRTKLAGFGVARMGDLKPEQVVSLKAELDGLVAKKKAGG